MKLGMIMMALALVIAAVVVRVTVGSEPGRVAAEVARKAVREAPRNTSEKQEESLRNGLPSLPDEPVRQRKEDAKEPVAAAFEPERSNSRSELPQPASQQTPSEPEFQPQQHQTQPQAASRGDNGSHHTLNGYIQRSRVRLR
jgi:hypothetical protein